MNRLDPTDKDHARALERLGSEIPIWLTTVRDDGQPQTSPVWFLWDGEVFHLLSKPGAAKVRNIRANPRVSLHLQASESGGEDLLIVEGNAELEDQLSEDWLRPYEAKYGRSVEGEAWDIQSMEAEYSLGIKITPTRFRVGEEVSEG
jgi:PPOX class probable F420-dependent enzyme